VALFVGVLTITSLAADLPGKIRKLFAPAESTVQVIQQPLSGVIWDEGHEPLLALRRYCRNLSSSPRQTNMEHLPFK
jgi:hypothetical protein